MIYYKKMKYDTKKKFQTKRRRNIINTKRNKNKTNKNIFKKTYKRERLLKARKLFASVEEHTLL